MASRLWIYAGPQGHSRPVTEEALAALVAEGAINAETPVRPADVASWAPLAVWLPQLYPEPPKIPHPRGAWIDREPHPWRRYFARIIDSLVVGGLTWAVISVVFYLAAPIQADLFFGMFEGATGSVLNVFLTLVASIPGMALMTGLTGLTVGKWLFGIKVVRRDGRPIGVLRAFGRELQVWAQGLGLGLPLISLIAMVFSFQQLAERGHTPWDGGRDRVLLHRPMNLLQIVLILLAIPVLLYARFGEALLKATG
ncbi:MAG: RDD family protein [Caulobacter sp.]|nr:RDD family protein [Caulobacter sp.]